MKKNEQSLKELWDIIKSRGLSILRPRILRMTGERKRHEDFLKI